MPNDKAALVAFRVNTVETFTLSDMMFVNADALVSLQILQSESHPNSHMQGPNNATSGSKESLSVFGLFQPLASTSQGRQKLRRIFLRPSIDLSIIEERQRTTSVLLSPENQPMLEDIVKYLKKIKDIRTVVIHLQKGVSDVPAGTRVNRGVWASIQNFAFYTLKIMEALRGINHSDQPLDIITKVESQAGNIYEY